MNPFYLDTSIWLDFYEKLKDIALYKKPEEIS